MKHKRADIIDALVKMRIDKGASSKTIIQDFLMGELGYKQSYAYDLYQQARVKIQQLYDSKNEQIANEQLSRLESLYEDAVKAGEKKLALEINKEINKLTGVYAAEKIEITSNEIKFKFDVIKPDDEDIDNEKE